MYQQAQYPSTATARDLCSEQRVEQQDIPLSKITARRQQVIHAQTQGHSQLGVIILSIFANFNPSLKYDWTVATVD